MKSLHVEASGVARTEPEAVWSLVADASSYSSWGPWSDSGYDDAGLPQEVGTKRWMRYGRTLTRERITELEAPRRLGYTVIGGLPVRGYRSTVTLTPTEGGTRIHWQADWEPTLLGRLVHRKLRGFYPAMLQDLIAAAESSAGVRR
jgi:hypothetical protein